MASPEVQESERRSHRNEATIVIVRERRLKYRWSCDRSAIYATTGTGTALTPKGAQRSALRCARGSWLIGFDRLDREEIRVVSLRTTPPAPEEPDPIPAVML